MAVDMIARMISLDAAQSGGGTTDAYTKAETDELLDGKADLENGKVPASQLPSYVDDVLEYASTSAFPATGESGKIYVATDTNRTYRWGGSAYVEISESLALGETASTAYPGNKGKANADAIAKKPGEITTGKQYTIDGQTVIAGTGAEAFNDLVNNKAAGQYSHAEGYATTASGPVSHAEGNSTTASGTLSHAEGNGTMASGYNSHAEGQGTTAFGTASHAEGQGTTASAACAHAEGRGTTASNGECAHAEGSGSKAVANAAHAEGQETTATGQASHTEGVSTIANGKGAHAEGQGTTAVGDYTHAEGLGTTAVSACQHVQGRYNKYDANNTYAFIIGNGTDASHTSNAFCVSWSGSVTEGIGTTAYGTASHAGGRYNVEDANGTYAFIIGNGTADNARHNAFAIDWNGLIYVNGAATGVDISAFPSPADINTAITKANAAAPQSTTYTIAEVDTALAAKLNTSDVDAALSSTSTNPVQNKAVQVPVARLVDAGAKNLLKSEAQSITSGGVTFTVNSDGTYTLNGTATTSTWFVLSEGNTIKSGSYVLTSDVEDLGIDVIVAITPSKSLNATIMRSDTIRTATFTADQTGMLFAIRVQSGASVSNVVVKPMLCTAEDYAISPEFVPYTPSNRELYEMILALQNAQNGG